MIPYMLLYQKSRGCNSVRNVLSTRQDEHIQQEVTNIFQKKKLFDNSLAKRDLYFYFTNQIKKTNVPRQDVIDETRKLNKKQAESRNNERPEEKKKWQEKDASRKAESRNQEKPEEKKERQKKNAKRNAKTRNQEKPEEIKERQEKDASSKAERFCPFPS